MCDAFPEGIPKKIYLSIVYHLLPYPGDHGIQWEPTKDGESCHLYFKKIINPLCDELKVSRVRLISYKKQRRKSRASYRPKSKTIRYYQRDFTQGMFIHELAHHLQFERHPRKSAVTRMAESMGHGVDFFKYNIEI